VRVILIAHTWVCDNVPGYVPHADPEDVWPTDSTAEADELAEMAGRLCYQSWDRPRPQTASNRGYLANIIAQGHHSVLEHASATFYLDGISRNCTHELIRHRHLSFSEVSQRYVDVSTFRKVVPPALRPYLGHDPLELDSFFEVDEYHHWVGVLTEDGLSRKEARQAARFLLPGGLETKIIVTGNMRAWRDVLQKRLSPAADAEIREVAKLILQNEVSRPYGAATVLESRLSEFAPLPCPRRSVG
jgi:thymidylate synthase (FAD)